MRNEVWEVTPIWSEWFRRPSKETRKGVRPYGRREKKWMNRKNLVGGGRGR